jgi:EmrB/QacA subfamily drug resistance transporter
MNRITPLILAVALFMEMMDATVIATSLPAIAADIGADPISLKLAMTSYMVALAIFIPVSGWMADRFGARNVFRWAIFVFMAGSLASAASGSLGEFVSARFLQGLGGSMMTPLARLVLVRSTPRNQLVSAMAWLTVPALVGPMAGPPIGGYLTTFFSWQWIFLINIPIGTAGIIAATLYLPKTGYRAKTRLDWVGFLLAGVSFSGILFGVSLISLPVVPPVVGLAIVVTGLGAGAVFVGHIKRAKNPLFDPGLMRHTLFRASIISGSIFRIGVGATPFLLPLMLQLGFGLSPFESGMILFVGAVGAISAKLIAHRAFVTFGFRTILIATGVAGAVLLGSKGTFVAATPAYAIMSVLFFSGIMRSTFFTGVNALGFADVPNEEAGQATAMLAVSAQLSLAMGVALAGGLIELSTFARGGELSVADFQFAFFAVAGFTLLSIVPISRLGPGAGSEVSGHHRVELARDH